MSRRQYRHGGKEDVFFQVEKLNTTFTTEWGVEGMEIEPSRLDEKAVIEEKRGLRMQKGTTSARKHSDQEQNTVMYYIFL